MVESRLTELHTWLYHNVRSYLSMVDTGSVAVGDVFTPGRSDRDICLIFADNCRYQDQLSSVSCMIDSLEFSKEYLFSTLFKADFIGPLGSTHDFSHRFRCKTLLGEDLVHLVQLPSPEVTIQLYTRGIAQLKYDLERRTNHCGLWPDIKLRDKFYPLFKHAFMYLALRHYHETGSYPILRRDVAQAYGSPLPEVLKVMYAIDHQAREDIFRTGEELKRFLEKIQ